MCRFCDFEILWVVQIHFQVRAPQVEMSEGCEVWRRVRSRLRIRVRIRVWMRLRTRQRIRLRFYKQKNPKNALKNKQILCQTLVVSILVG